MIIDDDFDSTHFKYVLHLIYWSHIVINLIALKSFLLLIVNLQFYYLFTKLN